MKKKKVGYWILPILMLVFLTACRKSAEMETGSMVGAVNEEDSAKGRYVETEYGLPEGVGNIYAIKSIKGQNGVRLLTDSGLFVSNNEGTEWKKDEQVDLSKYVEDGTNIILGDLGVDGSLFLYVVRDSDFTANVVYITGDGDENVYNLDLGKQNEGNNNNLLLMASYSESGYIAAIDFNYNILLVSANDGTVVQKIERDQSYRNSVDCVGDMLIVQTNEGVELYDMDGNLLDSNGIITEMLSAQGMEDKVSEDVITSVEARESENGFYSCNSLGVSHYSFGGTVSETLINGNANSLGDTSYSIVDFTVCENSSIVVVLKNRADNVLELKRYEFDNSAAVRPTRSLAVYSLYENEWIRQGISIFNSSNTDIFADYVVGLDGDNSVTVSDAIKTLNTNIIVGNGPDILLLDGMDVYSFIANDILMKIDDVIEDVSRNDGLFTGIARNIQKDGNIYAVPARYKVPLLIGEAESIKEISDLQSLAEKVVSLNESAENTPVMGLFDEILLGILFDISASDWIMDNGTIDESKLTDFLEQVKKIQEVESAGILQEEIDELNEVYLSSPHIELDQISDISSEIYKLTIAEIGTLNYFNLMPNVIESVDGDFKLAEGQGKNIFIPDSILAINSRSNNQESSKVFLEAFLSSEIQSAGTDRGFPVNKKAFEVLKQQQFTDTEEVVSEGETDNDSELKRDIARLEQMIDTLNTSTLTDNVIKDAVIEAGGLYLKNETDISSAVASIMEKINIYLAE